MEKETKSTKVSTKLRTHARWWMILKHYKTQRELTLYFEHPGQKQAFHCAWHMAMGNCKISISLNTPGELDAFFHGLSIVEQGYTTIVQMTEDTWKL